LLSWHFDLNPERQPGNSPRNTLVRPTDQGFFMSKSRRPLRKNSKRQLQFESLEKRELLSASPNITKTNAAQLLDRAVVASARNDAIIAVVDRNGTILGVRVESGVPISDPATLSFAIDGAVAKARTAAYFSNDAGPGTALTTRTIRQISQTTITQREVQSNPNAAETDPTKQGPGYIAPIGIGGHFPADIAHTPPVDLFAIEHTNRAVLTGPGADMVFGTPDDEVYNIDPADIPNSKQIPIPYSYAQQTNAVTVASDSNNRGIATLPGGIPLYKNGVLVGGIGVFFPGTTGCSDFEQRFNPAPSAHQTTLQRENSSLTLQAEWIAFAATGGSSGVNATVGTLAGIPRVAGFDLPLSNDVRIFLAGISLDQVGQGSQGGVKQTLATGAKVGRGSTSDLGIVEQVTAGGLNYLQGRGVSSGWLVSPQSGSGLTDTQVERIIDQGIDTANKVRAQIRLPIGARSRMNFAVADLNGDVLGLYRMQDATVFSIDVSIAKARNTVYYASADLQTFDRVRVNDPTGAFLPKGVAFTNRTFRFLAEPRYPAGVDGSLPGAFSILREDWVDPNTGYNKGAPASINDIQTVLGYDSFFVGTNFHDPSDPANQNGVVFFPGSSALYKSGTLVGGLGVSGDGVDQDDVVTYYAFAGFAAPDSIRADQRFVRGVRLPYQKFSRNPFA
jgi:uncharacterized protein GlcG (DUF336 family)